MSLKIYYFVFQDLSGAISPPPDLSKLVAAVTNADLNNRVGRSSLVSDTTQERLPYGSMVAIIDTKLSL